MAATKENKVLIPNKMKELYEIADNAHHAMEGIRFRIQLLRKFTEYESNNEDPKNILPISILLEDIEKLLEIETEKAWQLHADFFNCTFKEGDDNNE